MYTRLYEHSTDKLTRARLYFSKSFSNLSVPETFRSETKKRFADQKTKGFLFSPDLCPRRKMERPGLPFLILTSSNANTIVNNNDYQPSRADVSLHEKGGMEFEICTRINPISFKGSSIISTLGRIYAQTWERDR